MIQWVGNSIPLFSLYKQWQKRELAQNQAKENPQPSKDKEAILRPSDIFYAKLIPALQGFKKNLQVLLLIDCFSNRKGNYKCYVSKRMA